MYPGHATISTTPSPLPIFSILDRAGEAHSATTASAVSRKLPDKRSLRHDITSPYCGFPAGKHPSYRRRRPNDWSTVGDQHRLLAPELKVPSMPGQGRRAAFSAYLPKRYCTETSKLRSGAGYATKVVGLIASA